MKQKLEIDKIRDRIYEDLQPLVVVRVKHRDKYNLV